MRTQRFSTYLRENSIHRNQIISILKNNMFIIDRDNGGHNYPISDEPYQFTITDRTAINDGAVEWGYPGGNYLRYDEFCIILGYNTKTNIMQKLSSLINDQKKLAKDIAYYNNMLIFLRKQCVKEVEEDEFKQWMLDKNLDEDGNIIANEKSNSTKGKSQDNGAVQPA